MSFGPAIAARPYAAAELPASRGASYALGKNLQLYGFVQLPLYQYVNGVQLTADWAFVAGASVRF
jgi:hypothetical protein